MSGNEILTIAQMSEADRLAVAAGIPALKLMENAGAAIADAVDANYPFAKVLVLCGPGNNGGDGFCAALQLKARGYEARVAALVEPASLKGEAGEMARRWRGPVLSCAPSSFTGASLIIDALFGAGLSRPLEGIAAEMVRAANASGLPILSADVPSGLHGDLGLPLDGQNGLCIDAAITVTFFRKKPVHLLLPGRILCGQTIIADIGIPVAVLSEIKPQTFENAQDLWKAQFPKLNPRIHKYDRGHALAISGPMHATGAARLAARGALRVGAGLVSVASPLDAVAVNAAHLTAIMIKPFDGAAGLADIISDTRINACVIGPGCGVGAATKDLVATVLAAKAGTVIDADAITAFEHNPSDLFERLHARAVLTPHEGEFARLFPGLLEKSASRLDAAREAANKAGCVVLLKGPDTIVVAPGGLAAINTNAPPWLSTAGAGDVLAGMIAGLIAQGMDAFHAASAAAWLHGEAANRFSVGLIAEDIPEHLPPLLRALAGLSPPPRRRDD